MNTDRSAAFSALRLISSFTYLFPNIRVPSRVGPHRGSKELNDRRRADSPLFERRKTRHHENPAFPPFPRAGPRPATPTATDTMSVTKQ
jgi:hypothetical protein